MLATFGATLTLAFQASRPFRRVSNGRVANEAGAKKGDTLSNIFFYDYKKVFALLTLARNLSALFFFTLIITQ
jgi:hypothetical protein